MHRRLLPPLQPFLPQVAPLVQTPKEGNRSSHVAVSKNINNTHC